MGNVPLLELLPNWVAWLFGGIGAVAAVTDYITGKIYNWLTFPSILVGFIIVGITNLDFMGSSALGFGLATLLFLPLFFLKVFGAGDVKLVMAMGTVLGVHGVLELTFASFLIGGLGAFALLIRHKRVKHFFGQLWGFLRSIFIKDLEMQWPNLSKDIKAPFGIAIFMGYLWVWVGAI